MALSAAHRPLNPPFRRAPGASVKTARRMRRHLPGSFWVPFCGKKVQNTRDIVAAFSVLLMSTDARSTSRDRLRAMPCQKEENERSEVKSTKTSACRFCGNNLRPTLSGRSKNKTLRRKNTRRLGCGGSANSTLSALACGRLCQPPAPGTRAVGCSRSAASENAAV